MVASVKRGLQSGSRGGKRFGRRCEAYGLFVDNSRGAVANTNTPAARITHVVCRLSQLSSPPPLPLPAAALRVQHHPTVGIAGSVVRKGREDQHPGEVEKGRKDAVLLIYSERQQTEDGRPFSVLDVGGPRRRGGGEREGGDIGRNRKHDLIGGWLPAWSGSSSRRSWREEKRLFLDLGTGGGNPVYLHASIHPLSLSLVPFSCRLIHVQPPPTVVNFRDVSRIQRSTEEGVKHVSSLVVTELSPCNPF